jgi:ubiquinone/menaquinone biosynthesis C-methylase UbiE
MTKLEDTGERMIPELHKGHNIYGAHLARYDACREFTGGKEVLDIACGSGYGTKLIAQNAKKVYGIDIDQETVNYAKENYRAKNIIYKVGSATDIPLGDNSVDVVVSFETIEHIDDYEKYLQEIKRILRPGGVLVLSTPNDDEYIEDNEFHQHEFRYKQLKDLVKGYFKYQQFYFQTHWLYSTILPLDMHKSEWQNQLKTVKTQPLKPEQGLFFIVICSDKKISGKIEGLGVLGEHYRLVDVQANNRKIHAKHQALMDLKEQSRDLNRELVRLQNEIMALRDSKPWELTKLIQRTTSLVKKSRQIVKRINK